MSRPAFALLLGVAAALSGIIALEITDRSGDDDAVIPTPLRQPAPALRPAAARPADQAASWADAALARPLFNQTRRVAPRPETPTAAAPAGLPRIAGILVSPGGKSVIFAAGANGRPVVAAEGGRVGAYQVQSIEVGRVVVVGPEGPRVLSASFDAASPARPPPGAGPGANPGALGALGVLGAAPGGTGGGLSGLLGVPGLPQAPGQPGGPPLTFPGITR